MKIPEQDLERLHKIQLSLINELERICIANDIKFFVIAGTLLGAVRHEGFIPWDDDVDVGMLRDDYEKFVTCASLELSDDYFLQTWHTDAGFGLPLAKLRKHNTLIIEKGSKNTSGHKGIFLDIFPFDDKPKSQFAQMVHNFCCYTLKRLILARQGYSISKQGPMILAAGFWAACQISKLLNVSTLISLLELSMRWPNGRRDDADYVTIAGSYGYAKESLKHDWPQELSQVSFEGVTLPCFKASKNYLEHMYGNYMRLPAVEDRGKRHGVIELNFGD